VNRPRLHTRRSRLYPRRSLRYALRVLARADNLQRVSAAGFWREQGRDGLRRRVAEVCRRERVRA